MFTISVRQMAQVKNTAKCVAADVVKKDKLQAKITALVAEYKELEAKIADWQAPIKRMANGLTTEDLIIRTVTPYLNEDGTQKTDKDGHALTTTKFEVNPTRVSFDEDKRVYVVKEDADMNETTQAPMDVENNNIEAPADLFVD